MTYKRMLRKTWPLFLGLGVVCIIIFFYFAPSGIHGNKNEPLNMKNTHVRALEQKSGKTSKTSTDSPDKVRVVQAAKRIASKNKVLLVSFINNAFLPFAYSWFCNTKPMGIHDQVLVIAADLETEEELRQHQPGIEVVSVSGYTVKGSQKFTHAGYVRLGIKRTEMVKWILNENIGVFIIEFDCLWIRDPIPRMTSYTIYDLTITQVIGRKPGNVAIGFYYMSPSERMRSLWNELDRRLKVLDAKLNRMPVGKKVYYRDNDQAYLFDLLEEKYAGVRMKIVSQYEFPDGKWYNFTDKERLNYHPYIINNNWVIGTETKMQRAKDWGHWFLKEDGKCDEEQVEKIVKL